MIGPIRGWGSYDRTISPLGAVRQGPHSEINCCPARPDRSFQGKTEVGQSKVFKARPKGSRPERGSQGKAEGLKARLKFSCPEVTKMPPMCCTYNT